MSAILASKADELEAKRDAAIAALPALEAERDAAEAGWVDGGVVRMWCARDAVERQQRSIDRLMREAAMYRRLSDIRNFAR